MENELFETINLIIEDEANFNHKNARNREILGAVLNYVKEYELYSKGVSFKSNSIIILFNDDKKIIKLYNSNYPILDDYSYFKQILLSDYDEIMVNYIVGAANAYLGI